MRHATSDFAYLRVLLEAVETTGITSITLESDVKYPDKTE